MKHRTVKYWVAGHITSFFYISDENKDLLNKGSLGAGFNIDQGVITEVSSHSQGTEIIFNGQKQEFGKASVSESVLYLIEDYLDTKLPFLKINHNFQIPLSSGFGASAAGALGLTFSLNKLLELGMEEKILWQLAHKAEIINKSGLGDILGLYCNSSFELRLKEGAPGFGEVKSLNFNNINKDFELFTITEAALSTKKVLTNSDDRKKIKIFGLVALKNVKSNLTFKTFMKISNEFCNSIDLLPKGLLKIKQDLEQEFYVSQIMLGNGLFVFVPKEKLNQFNFWNLKNSKTPFIKRNLAENTIKEVF